MNAKKAAISEFRTNGFCVVEDLLSAEEVAAYLATYNRFLDGTIDCGQKRSDLGAGVSSNNESGAENITQIMWPSALVPVFREAVYHQRALQIVRGLLGDDVELDFDMLIDKAPRSNTATPWHQDCAYWIDLPDKRAASIWLALDEATIDNGCMWYVPGSHRQPVRPHRPAGTGGGALVCEADESEGIAVPLRPGSAVIHAGATLHYARGNSTDGHRRAFILNFRPAEMIALEREQGMDHGLTVNERMVRNVGAR